MDLELEGSEVAVGSFAADLLLRDRNSGERVAVENLIGNTDHDHLGKLITYAAGLEARYAVLVAGTFRPEHRSALLWLNANSQNSVGFFGIVLRAWRIRDSPKALQLSVVVQPDEWRRAIVDDDKATPVQRAYRDFWSEFLPAFQERHPAWSRAKSPSRVSWFSLPAGKAGVSDAVAFSARRRLRVDLYVDGDDPEHATGRYDDLRKRQGEIEKEFGDDLEWEHLKGRRASRIASYYGQDDVRVEERHRWPELRAWAIERVGALRKAVQSHVDAVE